MGERPVNARRPTLEADLSVVTMAGLLQFLEMEVLSGRLHVGEVGAVDVRRGQAVHAEVGDWEGVDALCDLFVLTSGAAHFELRDDDDLPTRPLGPVGGLVIEGSRRVDELRRLGGWIVEATDGAPERAAFDGSRTVIEAAAAAGRPATAVARDVSTWLREGLLRDTGRRGAAVVDGAAGWPAPAPADGAAGLPEAFYDLLDFGRDRLRDRDLVAAAAAFRKACGLRPDDRLAAQNLRRVETMMEDPR